MTHPDIASATEAFASQSALSLLNMPKFFLQANVKHSASKLPLMSATLQASRVSLWTKRYMIPPMRSLALGDKVAPRTPNSFSSIARESLSTLALKSGDMAIGLKCCIHVEI